jgi:hypothetical protein
LLWGGEEFKEAKERMELVAASIKQQCKIPVHKDEELDKQASQISFSVAEKKFKAEENPSTP